MSVSYFVRYVGTVEDARQFLQHYRTEHAAIMREYPRIRSCRLHHPVDWDDPVAVNKDAVFLLAELVFDSVEDLNFSLHSEVRQKSRADFMNFPRLEGEVRHLAVSTEILF
ncbi:MAG: EthD family reductase [Castellaniella sp.]|uniref:EthD family reductase n=1 Tax=Castellaniella hirudinis TaxID=1144617 RepID=A0ABV8RU04_9BURK